MAEEPRPSDPGQLKQFKQLMALSAVALVVVWSLVWASYSHGAAKAIGLAIGTPILMVSVVVLLRLRREL